MHRTGHPSPTAGPCPRRSQFPPTSPHPLPHPNSLADHVVATTSRSSAPTTGTPLAQEHFAAHHTAHHNKADTSAPRVTPPRRSARAGPVLGLDSRDAYQRRAGCKGLKHAHPQCTRISASRSALLSPSNADTRFSPTRKTSGTPAAVDSAKIAAAARRRPYRA